MSHTLHSASHLPTASRRGSQILGLAAAMLSTTPAICQGQAWGQLTLRNTNGTTPSVLVGRASTPGLNPPSPAAITTTQTLSLAPGSYEFIAEVEALGQQVIPSRSSLRVRLTLSASLAGANFGPWNPQSGEITVWPWPPYIDPYNRVPCGAPNTSASHSLTLNDPDPNNLALARQLSVTGSVSATTSGANVDLALMSDYDGRCQALTFVAIQTFSHYKIPFSLNQTTDLTFTLSIQTEGRGVTQSFPIFPTSSTNSVSTFAGTPSGQWVDPPLALGYDFQQTGTSLFTDILSLPVGIDGDGLFEVLVGTQSLGQFAQGSRVNFVQLLGQGVPGFRIAGIDPAKDATDVEAFPVQLAFDTPTADFTMTPVTWRSVGTSCVELGSCPACSPVTLAPTGDALLGNANFGLQLQNAPAGGFSLFAISVGHPSLQPFLCGSLGLSLPFLELGSVFNSGAGPCGSTVSTGLPIPNDPYLFGYFVTAQSGFLCPAGGLGLSNTIEFPIGS